MSRTSKQLLYGGFYLIFWVIIIGFIYLTFFKSIPTCFDQVENQTETDIDCGGVCGSCAIHQAKQPKVLDSLYLVGANNQLLVLAQLQNPNSLVSISKIPYRAILFDKNNQALGMFKSTANLYIGESRWVSFVGEVPDPAKISSLKIELDPAIFNDQKLEAPIIRIQNDKKTINGTDWGIEAEVLNPNPFLIKNITILSLMRDQTDLIKTASQTFITELKGFETQKILLKFPNFPNVKFEDLKPDYALSGEL